MIVLPNLFSFRFFGKNRPKSQQRTKNKKAKIKGVIYIGLHNFYFCIICFKHVLGPICPEMSRNTIFKTLSYLDTLKLNPWRLQ